MTGTVLKLPLFSIFISNRFSIYLLQILILCFLQASSLVIHTTLYSRTLETFAARTLYQFSKIKK